MRAVFNFFPGFSSFYKDVLRALEALRNTNAKYFILSRNNSAKSSVPAMLTGLRVMLAPVMLLLAWYDPRPPAFAVCLTLAFLSDVFDGILARRLNVATPGLRRVDSIADSVF